MFENGQNPVDVFFTTSWDDGNNLDLRLVDLLKKYELSATFYIPANLSPKTLTSTQIRDISSEFDIGAHTMTHVRLVDCSDEKAAAEITASKMFIESITGKVCESFCFPEGKFVLKHVEMVKKAGFRGCRSVELLNNRFPASFFGIYLLPTTIQVYPHTSMEYVKNMIKRKAILNLANFNKIDKLTWFDSSKLLFMDTIKKGGVFHLWGHSWEIEEMNLWLELENFFGFVKSFHPFITSCSNSGLYEYINKKST
jgi:peptidoglycan/xylan/chitin deacetylase (PgdA/CDA1 family)